jgi:hypothetical protein
LEIRLSSFLAAVLILLANTSYFINPILIGNGIPMFNDTKERINVNLAGSSIFASEL